MVVRGDRRAADLRRPLAPELRHHLAILVPDLAPEIAGIAGAGAVAGGLGIEDHRVPPPAHQRKRGGKPHIAGAHDHHLGLRRRPLVRHVGARRQVPPVGGGAENPPSARRWSPSPPPASDKPRPRGSTAHVYAGAMRGTMKFGRCLPDILARLRAYGQNRRRAACRCRSDTRTRRTLNEAMPVGQGGGRRTRPPGRGGFGRLTDPSCTINL